MIKPVLAGAVLLAALAPSAQAAAPAGPWDAFNLSPASRTVAPVGVLKSGGDVSSADGVTSLGPNAYVTLDFGKEVGGFVKLHFTPASSATGAALTYSEWSTYASPTSSDASNGSSNNEPPVVYPAPAGGSIDTGTTPPAAGAPVPSLTGAQWIWSNAGANSSAPASTVYFRKTFTVDDPSKLSSAMLRVNVDDNETTYVNGVQVASMGNSFQTSAIADIKPQLVAGTNVVAIKAANASVGPAGTLAKLVLGDTTIVTDTTWKTSQTGPDGWNTAGFDDSAWPNAFANGAYGAGPWGTFGDPSTSGAGTNSSTTLTADAAAGDTAINVAGTTYLTKGTKLDVGGETARVDSISATTVTLTAPLASSHASGTTVWQANSELRGGFRYLTISNPGSGTLQFDSASVGITFAPNMSDLRAYPNYFYSDDALINRIWYAGAYTVQTNIIANDQGRVWNPAPAIGWNNGAVVGESAEPCWSTAPSATAPSGPATSASPSPTDYVSLGDIDDDQGLAADALQPPGGERRAPLRRPGGELHRQLRHLPHVDADRHHELLPVHGRQGVAGLDLAQVQVRAELHHGEDRLRRADERHAVGRLGAHDPAARTSRPRRSCTARCSRARRSPASRPTRRSRTRARRRRRR